MEEVQLKAKPEDILLKDTEAKKKVCPTYLDE